MATYEYDRIRRIAAALEQCGVDSGKIDQIMAGDEDRFSLNRGDPDRGRGRVSETGRIGLIEHFHYPQINLADPKRHS
jgi:hypothetical protein